jgi:polysaccharide biosynthesis protein PelA
VNPVAGLERRRALVVESGWTGRHFWTGWRKPLLLLAALLAAVPARARSGHPAVAFFYGKPVPVTELSHFDWVVVEPENLDARGLAELQGAGVLVFGYLSLGEAAPGEVDSSWVLGRNAGWNSVIVNPASPGWRARILDRAQALRQRGYRGLFLDTLDSHVGALRGEEARRAARTALAGLVQAIHDRHPDLKLFFNRGFEILDDVGRLACGLAAESLFFGWSAEARQYVEVPEPGREWLAGRLRQVRDRLGIPVVVVDYLPPGRREVARETARRIEAMGFTPWVSTPSLDVLGVGSVEVVPRRVLLLYDGAEAPGLRRSFVHRLAALPVEYLGFAADYLDVRRGLPPEPLAGRYAGIVTWFTDDDLPDAIGYPEWLMRQIEAGVRVAMLARPGFPASKSFLARLGLAAGSAAPAKAVRVAKRDELVGFEAEPALRSRGLVAWHAAAPEVAVHLRVEDARGFPIDPVVTAPWGGMALDPYLLEIGYQGRARWIVDPFRFLEAALALPEAPALDLSTENGARLLVVVADGEALAHPSGGDAGIAAAEVLHWVLTALPVPTTVAMPAGEPGGGTGRKASRLDRMASAILALPNVEPAGRSSTLPRATNGATDVTKGDVEASIERLRGLLPEGKEPRTFLWPDGELATPDGIAAAAALGLVSVVNGHPRGAGAPSLAELQPSGCPVGERFQVYLPGWNDAGASGIREAKPFDRERLLALAARPETSRPVQPIGLTYQVGIGTRPAAARSVEKALRLALNEGALPLWASEYAERVRGFHEASMARRLDGTWQFRGMKRLRTVRISRALGWPDLARSRGVAGVADLGAWRYVSFGPEERPILVLSDRPTPGPYLAWANVPLERWAAQGQATSLRLQGHVPVRLAVGGTSAPCTLVVEGRKVRPERAGGRDTFSLAVADTGDARIECGRP